MIHGIASPPVTQNIHVASPGPLSTWPIPITNKNLFASALYAIAVPPATYALRALEAQNFHASTQVVDAVILFLKVNGGAIAAISPHCDIEEPVLTSALRTVVPSCVCQIVLLSSGTRTHAGIQKVFGLSFGYVAVQQEQVLAGALSTRITSQDCTGKN